MQIFWGQSNKSRAQSVCKFIRSAHSCQSESDLKHKLGKLIIYPISEGDLRKVEYEPMDTPGNMTTAQMPLGYYGFFAYFVAQFKAAAWREDHEASSDQKHDFIFHRGFHCPLAIGCFQK